MTSDNIKKQLVEKALSAMHNAHAPYSEFFVGAAIIDENDNIHTGCNVENAAYPEGVCAEASAISQMVVNGGRVIKEIMLVSSGDRMVTPCGGCRQKIKEFSTTQTRICVHHNNQVTSFSIDELLPHSFSEVFLK